MRINYFPKHFPKDSIRICMDHLHQPNWPYRPKKLNNTGKKIQKSLTGEGMIFWAWQFEVNCSQGFFRSWKPYFWIILPKRFNRKALDPKSEERSHLISKLFEEMEDITLKVKKQENPMWKELLDFINEKESKWTKYRLQILVRCESFKAVWLKLLRLIIHLTFQHIVLLKKCQFVLQLPLQ